MAKETLSAKLRNQLTPLYSLAEMIVLGKDNPEILDAVIECAENALENRKTIDKLLTEIDKLK